MRLLPRLRKSSGDDDKPVDVEVSVYDKIECQLCKKLLALDLNIYVKPFGRYFGRVLKFEEYIDIEYMIAYKPGAYPPDYYHLYLCRECYERLQSYVRGFIDELTKKVESYSAHIDRDADAVLVFSSLRELKRFVESHALIITVPRLGWVELGNPRRSVYGLVLHMVPKRLPTHSNEGTRIGVYPILRLYTPITDIVREMKGVG